MKKCYYNPNPYNNSCKLFLTEKTHEYIPFIQKYLDGCINEIANSLVELDKIKAIRSQVVLLIIFGDLSSKVRVWFKERNPASDGNDQRLKNWFNRFVYTEKNKYWNNNEQLHKFTAEDFVKLRNSLLHKFALPKENPKNWKSIILNNGSNYKLTKNFKENILLSPFELMNLIWDWYALMIEEMKKNINDIEYLKWINYVWLQLYKEWAVLVRWTDKIWKVIVE